MKAQIVSFVILILCALLTGCGSSNLATINAINPSPSATAASPPTLVCGPASESSPYFCITPAERALGQTPVHMTTVPDSVFINAGAQLTIAPNDKPLIGEAQAETLALRYAQRMVPTARLDEAVLAEWHNLSGLPTSGQLTWVIHVTPANGVPVSEVPGGGSLNGGVAIPTGSTSITVPRSQLPSTPTHMIVTVDATSGEVTGALFQ